MSTDLGPVVLLLIGPPGQQMHAASREMTDSKAQAGRRWYDVNIQGTHLPQMYTPAEEISLTGPIAAASHGLCPACLGWGQSDFEVCSLCAGTGRLGVAQEVQRDGSSTIVSVKWDPKDMDHISCDVCRAAFKVIES